MNSLLPTTDTEKLYFIWGYFDYLKDQKRSKRTENPFRNPYLKSWIWWQNGYDFGIDNK